MAITEKYANFDLATGSNDGTSEANAWQAYTDITFAAGERVNLKTPTQQSIGADWTISTNATDTAPVALRGYSSTIGDGGFADLSMGAFSLIISGEGFHLESISVTGNDTNTTLNMSGDLSHCHRCKAYNTGTAALSYKAAAFDSCNVTNCYFETTGTNYGLTAGDTIAVDIARGTIRHCIIKSTNIGLHLSFGFNDVTATGVLIYESGSLAEGGALVNGLASGGMCSIADITVNGFDNSIHCIAMQDITDLEGLSIVNALLANATTGINNPDLATRDAPGVMLDTIAFYNNTTDADIGDFPIVNQIDLTADPFTNAASDDFSLNNTAGGGADCRAVSNFGAGEVTNYRDVGALQHQDSGGGLGIIKQVGDGGGMVA